MDVSNQLYLALWFFRDLQGMSRILSQCLLCQMVPPSQGDLKSSLKSKCLFCAPHLFFLKTLGFCSILSPVFVRERKVRDLSRPSHLWDFSTHRKAKLPPLTSSCFEGAGIDTGTSQLRDKSPSARPSFVPACKGWVLVCLAPDRWQTCLRQGAVQETDVSEKT